MGTADNLRANAGLKANEYEIPLLGLIFLKYATNWFKAVPEKAEKEYEESLLGREEVTIG